MLLSEVKNKKILNLSNAKIIGEIDGVVVDKQSAKIIGLSTRENIGILATANIFSVSDLICVLNDDCITAHTFNDSFVLNERASVYNVNGEHVGSGIDIDLNSRKKECRIICNNTEYKLKTIVSSSDDIIVINPTYRALYKQERKPERAIYELNPPPTDTTNEAPITSDYNYLIGRKVKSEVSDIGRSFVLMAGTLITDRIIQNARKAGKISELINKSY